MNLLLELLAAIVQFIAALFIAIYHSIIPPPRKSVEGELVLITGAGSGLGRLMCREFAKLGASIIACDIDNKGNEETAEIVQKIISQRKALGITNKAAKIHTFTCDISSREKVYSLASQIKQTIGNPTVLINNAGIVCGKSFLDIPDEMIKKTIDVNLMSHFWTVKAFLPAMMAKNHGHIVNIASIAGVIGGTRLTDYCASKFGDVGFTESLQLELQTAGKTGVKTTTVCPYMINTGMFDGAGARFPTILPPLDPEETVNRIMQAILTDQTILFIPRLMYFLGFLKGLLPVKAALIIHEFTGATNFMDNFRGRNKKKVK